MQYTSQIEMLQRRWQDNLHGTMFAPLAEAYRKAGMFEDALGALEIGLSRHPKYIPGHIVSGRCYLDLKDEVKAEEAFVKVVELDAENVIALKALADLAERGGRREMAIERLERLLDFDPANEDALAQLARVMAVPVMVVAPLLEDVEPEEPEAPAEEVLIGQGEVTDAAGADFDVQLFQPIELMPIDSTEFQVPNDAESLRIRESGSFSSVEPRVPAADELVELSMAPPAEPPVEPIATLDEIPLASDGLELRPDPGAAETEPALPVAEAIEPAGDDPPPDIAVEAAVPPVEAPSVDPDSVTVALVDIPPPRLTLEPTLLQLPVIPPLPPAAPAPAAVPEDLTTAVEEPVPDVPAIPEAVAEAAEPEPVAEPEGLAAVAQPAPAGDAPPPAADAAGSAEPEPAAEPERLTVAAEEPAPVSDVPAPAAGSAEPEPVAERESPTAAAEAPAASPAWSPGPEPPAEPERLTAAAEQSAPAPAPAPADVPTMAGILAGSAVPEPVEEDAPSATEPELVVTETMAEIFLRQGYAELALAVYSQLATREPGNRRIEAAKARLLTELVPPVPEPAREAPVRRLAVATTGGRPATAWLAEVLSVGPPGAAPPVHPPAFEPPLAAEPTRAATDTLSLSSVFGDETAAPAPADSSQTAEESGPSFDEFFGTPAEPASLAGEAPSGSGQPIEDLEQFNAWLKGLKR